MKRFIVFALLIAIMTFSFGCSTEKPTDLSGTLVLSADDGANDPDMTENSIYAPDFEETTFKYKHGMILFDYYVNGVAYTFHFERAASEEAA